MAAGVLCIAVSVNLHNRVILAALAFLAFILLVQECNVVIARLIPVNVFAAMLWLAFPLGAYLGSSINALGGAPDYSDALKNASLYTLRINIAALHCMIFIIPLGIGDVSNTLLKLRVPKKLVTLLILTYRYVFVLTEKVFTSSLSLRIRKPARFSKREELRCYGNMFGSSVIAAEMRSSKVWTAMRSRGFNESFPLTKTFAWKGKDTMLIVSCVMAAASLAALDTLLDGRLTGV
jgi:cobalt/nickel transport system permease protein